MQTLTKPLTGAAQATLKADHMERDRVAWNLPRDPVEIVSYEESRDGLNWDNFRDLYYPDSRRHDFEAIVAYGDYKRAPRAGSPTTEVIQLNGDANSTDAPSLAEWEAAGGTTP